MGRRRIIGFWYFAAVLIATGINLKQAQAVEIPPTPTAHYYGDADGNVSVNLSDIAQHNAYTSFKPCTYDTLQPQTGGQYWNTCDVDGSRSCNLSDIAILNSYMSFKPVNLGGDPWVLENVNLPLSSNAPNTWIPFNINLYMTYSGAPSGRPGISVIAEIDPASLGHGQLSGRSCTPVAGTRDQFAAAGAQCALAVTITDWQSGQEGLGLTESDTYGFQVWGDGDGDLKIDFHIEEWAAMDVPSVILSQTIGFSPPNQPPEWTSTAPTTASEDVLYTYDMTANDPESDPVTFQVNVTTDTCGGSVVGSQYSFTPDETSGGLTCVVGVQACDFTGSGGCADQDTTITVDETNLDPTVTVDCPASVIEDTATSCTLSAADADLPAQNLSCSLAASLEGAISVGNGSTESYFPFGTSDEVERTQAIYLASEIGTAGKIYSLALYVAGEPGQTMENFTIRMKHTDLSDYFSSDSWEGPASGWTTVFQDNLTITSTGWHTFTLTTPFLYNGDQNLMIDFSFYNSSRSSDGYVYTYYPISIRVLYQQTSTAYGDPLLWSGMTPAYFFEWNIPNIRFVMDASCNGMTINGCDSIDIPGQGESSTGCDVIVSISDDFTPPGTGEGSDTIIFQELNQNPTLTVNCPANVGENTASTCDLAVTDGDVPPQTHTCTVDAATTCTGVTVTGCTQANVPPQGEGANPRTCDVVINVEDDFSPPGSGQGSDTITLDNDNADPTVTVDCPASMAEDTATSCTLSVADIDLPPQNLTCNFGYTDIDIGSGTTDLTMFPLGDIYSHHDSRSQAIYLASEIDFTGRIMSLSIDVLSVPGQTLNNFTIRMKHTNLGGFNNPYTWEGPSSGWTTVFQDNVTISSTGWYKFTFTTPFEYNGIQNLMVDFSFNNDSSTLNGSINGSFSTSPKRTIYYGTDSLYGDPLDWSGTSNPTPYPYSYFPNIRLAADKLCQGMVLNGCDSIDIPAQGEVSRQSCDVSVVVSDDYTPPGTGQGIDTINIDEVNQDPTVTVDCPASVGENTATTCALTVSDSDLPPQAHSCSADVSSTCTGVTVTDCTQANVPPQGEGSNPRTCDVVIKVEDDFSPPESGLGSDTITLDEDNEAPTIAVDCPVGVGEDTATSCTLSVADADLPPQNLTCSLIPASPMEVTVGSGTSTTGYPVNTFTHDERTQVIYLASEIGMGAPITALALNVYSASGKTMNNFTIRMKHTDLNEFTSPYAWDGPSSGWTTVFQSNVTISSTGWHTFTLTTPFLYNGVQNLMIDFSFNNTSTGPSSAVYSFASGVKRVVYYSTNSGYGDPLLWSGTSNPTPYSYSYVPNLAFTFDALCTGAVLNGCDSIDIPAQGEIPSSLCKVSVSVSDDYVPPGTAQGDGFVGIVESNQAPTVTVDCPPNVGENTTTTCALTASDGDLPPQTYSCSVDASTTCTGVTLTGCTQADVPPQGEGSNPRTCDVVINVEDDFSPPGIGQGSDTITLDEDNENPTITVDCPASVAEDTATSCILTATDIDLPAQGLTCSLNASTTCAGASITDCAQVDVPAQGEAAVSCSVVVDIQDDYLPVNGTGQGGDTMDIDEVNQDPTIIVDCPSNVGENTATTCALTVSDGDLPPQALSCTVDAASTCSGVTLTCTNATVPPQGEGPNPRTCDVIINVQDDFDPPGLGQGSDTITLDEEYSPLTWNPLPSDLTVDMNKPYTGVNGHGTDVDDPAPLLTCQKTSQTCSFAVTVSGSGSGEVDCNFSFTPSGSPEQCEVDVEVTDGMTLTVTDTVTVNTVGVWYVDDTATGANNGTSWTDAFNILQDAVDAASAGDMIWVAEGIYTRRSGDHDPVLTMKQGVQVYGGFAGTESSLSERGDPLDYETVLNGENQSYHVIIGSSYATIDGFSVINGNAEYIRMNPYGPYPRYYCECYSCCEGGGMFNAGVNNLYINNCIFKQNSAARHGGAMININSSPLINNSIFSRNRCYGYYEGGIPHVTFGGGISNEGGSSPYIYNSVIMGNRAIQSGGGIFNGGGSTSLVNCLVTSNSVWTHGGGVYNLGGYPSIYNCTFSGNHVDSTSGRAVHNKNSPALISNSILWGDTGDVGGSEIGHSGAAYPTVTYSDVEGGYPGTGNINADPLFMGDLLGPGTWTADPVYNPGLFVTTLTDDTQSWAPSALKRRFINPDTTSPFALYLILDNTSTTITVRGNITSGVTMGDSYKIIDYHIGSASPCKDTGTSTGAPSNDLDGNPRPAGGGFDMGAFEYQGMDCADGIDNDGDTYIDWPFDPGCLSLQDTSEYLGTECDDGVDNDGDTFIDWPADPECTDIFDNTEDMAICMDGIDNDGDTLTDYPADPGCESLLDDSEYLGTECDDGVDNDGDTLIDFPDDTECSNISDIHENNWIDIGTGSSINGGISNDTGWSGGPSLVLDSSGFPVVAWHDKTTGNWEIYIKRWDGNAWVDIGAGSSSGGGISNNSGASVYPSLALDSSGNPVVAWHDSSSGNYEIYIKRWDGGAWVDIGTGSSSGGGISNDSGTSQYSSLALDSSGYPVVAWADNSSGNYEIYIKRWNGSAWEDIGTGSSSGGGISNNGGASQYPSIYLDSSGYPVVAWHDSSSGNNDIYIKRWDGGAWVDIGAGSSSGGGISNDNGSSEIPSLALDSSQYPIVAWRNIDSGIDDIYIKRWNGSAWEDIGAGSSSGGGISNSSGSSAIPSIGIDSSENPIVTWQDYTLGNWEIYIKRWNGGAWEDIGIGSSSGGGISENSGDSAEVSLALDSSGNPVVAWRDLSYGNWEIYIKRWSP